MNLRQLEIYRAVMTGGSASRGAALLGISQPAVSRALADLEHALGFLLFERVRGQLRPTPEGRLFFRDIDESFLGLDRLRMSAARIRDFGSGSLRVASLAALGSTLVPRVVRAFAERYPETALTLQVASSARVRDLVASGRFDLGVAADEVDLSGLEHRAFPDLAAVCVLAPGHPLAGRAAVRPADLDGQAFIALVPEDRARQRLERVLEDAAARPRVVVETPHSATVCALALEGVGIGLANPAVLPGFTERGLVARPFAPEVPFRAHLLFHPDARRSRQVKAFTALLLDAGSRLCAPRPSGSGRRPG
jgi:DNA-binding transcriptional LysR family regulator